MGKGKSMTIYPWLTAYQTARLGNLSYVEVSMREDMKAQQANDEIMLQDESPSVISILMKKDLVEQLSREAKEVIRMILNGPQEVIDSLHTEKYDKISKEKIRDNLIAKGWNKKLVIEVFNELRNFTKELSDI